ncbi:MAG: hypothetical protein MHPSP_003534, partial [Paramarteilia canceri]
EHILSCSLGDSFNLEICLKGSDFNAKLENLDTKESFSNNFTHSSTFKKKLVHFSKKGVVDISNKIGYRISYEQFLKQLFEEMCQEAPSKFEIISAKRIREMKKKLDRSEELSNQEYSRIYLLFSIEMDESNSSKNDVLKDGANSVFKFPLALNQTQQADYGFMVDKLIKSKTKKSQRTSEDILLNKECQVEDNSKIKKDFGSFVNLSRNLKLEDKINKLSQVVLKMRKELEIEKKQSEDKEKLLKHEIKNLEVKLKHFENENKRLIEKNNSSKKRSEFSRRDLKASYFDIEYFPDSYDGFLSDRFSKKKNSRSNKYQQNKELKHCQRQNTIKMKQNLIEFSDEDIPNHRIPKRNLSKNSKSTRRSGQSPLPKIFDPTEYVKSRKARSREIFSLRDCRIRSAAQIRARSQSKDLNRDSSCKSNLSRDSSELFKQKSSPKENISFKNDISKSKTVSKRKSVEHNSKFTDEILSKHDLGDIEERLSRLQKLISEC